MNAFIKEAQQAQSAHQTLDELAALWNEAKEEERQANARRVSIESKIAEMVGVKDEGVTSVDGQFYKVKTTGKLTRSVDSDAVQNVWEVMPEEVRKCFKWEAKLDTKNYRALCSMRDDLIPELNRYITTKPAKASISIEEIKDGN